MSKNDLIDDMNEFEEKESNQIGAEESLNLKSFQKELDNFRKKERKKMLFAGFLAGIMMTVGVAMYVTQANADSDYYSQLSDSGSSGYNGSYASYSSQAGGGAGGGCCGGGGGSALENVSLEDLEKQALQQYEQEKGSSKDVTAKAADYGCHTQIDIKDKAGKIVRSYGYQGDQLYVIS